MKKTVAVFLTVLLLASLTGCGARQKAAEKIADKITEGIVKKVTGEDIDVDISEGKTTIKGEDGTAVTFGGNEWPKGEAADQVPEFKKGKINAVINSAENCWIEIEEVSEANYQQYVEALKSAGFDQNGSEYSDLETRIYSAYKGEDYLVTVTYSGGDTMVIQIMKSSN